MNPIRINPSALLLLLTILIITGLSSCSGVISGITGQPVASTPVLREGAAVPVNVATADLIQAEVGDPKKVYGLYDVGVVAGAVGKVTNSGK